MTEIQGFDPRPPVEFNFHLNINHYGRLVPFYSPCGSSVSYYFYKTYSNYMTFDPSNEVLSLIVWKKEGACTRKKIELFRMGGGGKKQAHWIIVGGKFDGGVPR